MPDVLGGRLERGADEPDDGRNLKSTFSAEEVGDVTSDDGADEGAAGHGGGDAALEGAAGVVKVVEVLVGDDPGAHGADVEAEEHAADRAKGSDDWESSSVNIMFWG